MSNGYASNIARCANPDKGNSHGVKSHDCHVFMECLLPIAFRSLPEFVCTALAEVSRFFRDLCSNHNKTTRCYVEVDHIPNELPYQTDEMSYVLPIITIEPVKGC